MHFFKNNLSYKSFETFRNVLIKPINNFYDYFTINNYFNLKYKKDDEKQIVSNCFIDYCKQIITLNQRISMTNLKQQYFYYVDKFVFTTHQYHAISEFKSQILEIIKDSLGKIKHKLIKKCKEHEQFFITSNKHFFNVFKKLYSVFETNSKNNNKYINELFDKYDINVKHLLKYYFYSKNAIFDHKTYLYVYLMSEFKNEYKIKGIEYYKTNNFFCCGKINVMITDENFTSNIVYLFIKNLMKKSYIELIDYLYLSDNEIQIDCFDDIISSFKTNLNFINNNFSGDAFSLNYNEEHFNNIIITTFLRYFYKHNKFT